MFSTASEKNHNHKKLSDYKVSARKYRPQRFSDVSSQEFVTQTLKNAIISNKIAHSYLFSGPRGVGKTTIARIYAKALNCTNLKEGEPCNECDSCKEITSGIHPDVFELDAASNRGIDDVRAIQDAAKFFPIKGKYKFFIVDEVHMLTQQAFNALLKILEEPPHYLIFILATTNPEKIPETIVSRCQRFPLQRIKISEIINNIKEIAKEEKVMIDKDSLFLIAKLGDGALRDAQGIFDLSVSFCGDKISYSELKNFLNIPDKEIYFNISEFIREGKAGELLSYFNGLNAQGFDLQTFFNGIIEHFRNLMVVNSTDNADLLDESDSIKGKYSEESKIFTSGQISRLLKVLFEAENRFKYSSNQKILFESVLVELCRINSEVVDLSVIISEIEAVKKKSLTELSSVGIIASGSKNKFNPEIKTEIEPDVADKVSEKENNKTEKNKSKSSSDNVINGDKNNKNSESEVILKLKELFDAEEYKFN